MGTPYSQELKKKKNKKTHKNLVNQNRRPGPGGVLCQVTEYRAQSALLPSSLRPPFSCVTSGK